MHDDRTGAIAAHFIGAVAASRRGSVPFRHWLIEDALPREACEAVAALPFAPPPHGTETRGRRETLNSTRIFFSAENRARFPVCDAVAAALQDPATTERLRLLCGVPLAGSFLRIEYCQDVDGFWLEPHTDIGAKLFTMLVYLSTGPGAEAWGTDLLDGPEPERLVATVPCRFNAGLIFVPGSDTWHGFRPRPIDGVRKSLIVNYVVADWRSRHELAYSDRPVGKPAPI